MIVAFRYQRRIRRFLGASPPSFPRVTLQIRAQAIAIHQLEIMRAHEVHCKDTATYCSLQDRRKGMLLPGKPSGRYLPGRCFILNKTYLKNLIVNSWMWQWARAKPKIDQICCISYDYIFSTSIQALQSSDVRLQKLISDSALFACVKVLKRHQDFFTMHYQCIWINVYTCIR